MSTYAIRKQLVPLVHTSAAGCESALKADVCVVREVHPSEQLSNVPDMASYGQPRQKHQPIFWQAVGPLDSLVLRLQPVPAIVSLRQWPRACIVGRESVKEVW